MDDLTYNQLLAVCLTYVTNVVPPVDFLLLGDKKRLITASFIEKNFPPVDKLTHTEFLAKLVNIVESKVATDQVLGEFTKGKLS